MSTKLWCSPTPDEKRILIESVFGTDAGDRSAFDDYSSFFKNEIAVLRNVKYNASKSDDWPLPIKTYAHLVDVIHCLQNQSDTSTWDQMTQHTQNALPLMFGANQDLRSCIELALRLWLTVNFRNPSESSLGGHAPCIIWNQHETLPQCLARRFVPQIPGVLTDKRLSPRFTAAAMVSICGLRIEWTSSLDDHLRLDREHKCLWLFRHFDVLNMRAEPNRACPFGLQCSWDHSTASAGSAIIGPTSVKQASPMPLELFEETRRTFDLLFPLRESTSQKLLKSLHPHWSDLVRGDRQLELSAFPYWRHRLLVLHEDVFEAEADGLMQLWRDRRDPQKFWTFWIALVVFWLTMVSTVASIVQTWASLKGIGYFGGVS